MEEVFLHSCFFRYQLLVIYPRSVKLLEVHWKFALLLIQWNLHPGDSLRTKKIVPLKMLTYK